MSSKKPNRRPRRPALTPEGRENQLISLASDLAERQIVQGTASSQVITLLLKMGSQRERLERAKIEQENLLLAAKVEAIRSQKKVEELYAEALNAMRTYAGQEVDQEEDDFDEY